MANSAVKKYTVRTLVEAFQKQIVDNEMMPGLQLPQTHQLALRYGVSAKTIDRALTVLAQKGFIQRVCGKGSFVKTNLPRSQKLRIMLVNWAYSRKNQRMLPLADAAFMTFNDTLCKLMTEQEFLYDVFWESAQMTGDFIKKHLLGCYDYFILPAGFLEQYRQYFLPVKDHVVLYGDDEVSVEDWNQVVYDYRPGFSKLLEYCRTRNMTRFFLPISDRETKNNRLKILMECGEKLGYGKNAFVYCNAQSPIVNSSLLIGARAANYYWEQKLFHLPVISLSDFVTYGFMDVMSVHGLQAGKDYRIASYDNLASRLPQQTELQLTEITHPLVEHAQAVCDMVGKMLREPTRKYTRIYLTPANEVLFRDTL